MDQAIGLGVLIQSQGFPSKRNGLSQSVTPPSLIRSPHARTEDSDGYLGFGVEESVPNDFAAGGKQFDKVTRLCIAGDLAQLFAVHEGMPQSPPQPNFHRRQEFILSRA